MVQIDKNRKTWTDSTVRIYYRSEAAALSDSGRRLLESLFAVALIDQNQFEQVLEIARMGPYPADEDLVRAEAARVVSQDPGAGHMYLVEAILKWPDMEQH